MNSKTHFDGQTGAGSAREPVVYTGLRKADMLRHDGGLPPAAGVHSYQVMRSNRELPLLGEDIGWTYNHAPMLAYWRGKYYLEYLSSPVYENGQPTRTLLTRSVNGRDWEPPTVIFPSYPLPGGGFATAHQRMGFYVSSDSRLLVLAFYGIVEDAKRFDMPNDGRGIGRVIREVYEDGTFGPIYFIRYNAHAGWSEENTAYHYYSRSHDSGFVAACEELLSDRLATLQWWEEDRSTDGYYQVEGQKSFSYYSRKDGAVVGLWKWSKAALSIDNGESWTEAADIPSFIMAGAKVWGQRTADDRFAMVYNPVADNAHRWPLAVAVSEDGIHYDELLMVVGEVPPRRYSGFCKDYGPQYVRGIEAYDQYSDDGALWVTYSMNKEDIWISRIPVPISGGGGDEIVESFMQEEPGTPPKSWNVYQPAWTSVAVVERDDLSGRMLRISDSEPYDYARAERLFREAGRVRIQFTLCPEQQDHGWFEMELLDSCGSLASRLALDHHGQVLAGTQTGWEIIGRYGAGQSLAFQLHADMEGEQAELSLSIDGSVVREKNLLLHKVAGIGRLCFRTGPRRESPTIHTSTAEHMPDLPHAGLPTKEAVYLLSDIQIRRD